MRELRLYPFCLGSATEDKGVFTARRDVGVKIEYPIPAFLITHPKGNVLVDTGFHIEVATNPVACFGERAHTMLPKVGAEDDVLSQLGALGLEPKDMRYVINTHLHFDHCGCNQFFTNSTFLVQKDELRAAYWPETFMRGGYYRRDFDHPLNYEAIEGDYDVYGDGVITIMKSAGHTEGHQSVIVELPNDGTIVLTGDSCYLMENINELIPPASVWNPVEAVKSLRKLRYLRDIKGGMVIPGHDLEYWKRIKHAPDYYR